MKTLLARYLGRHPAARLQAGFTLMEGMISLALSTVVTAAMVLLMGNSMGTATRIIEMSQLSDELRNAMSMMSRDVRRAHYSPNALYCYGNPDCATDGSAPSGLKFEIFANNCFTFGLDRPLADDAGGFRLNPDGDGSIEMWVDGPLPSQGQCSGGNWRKITDPQTFNITKFEVFDTPPPPSLNPLCRRENDFSNVSSLTRTLTLESMSLTATQHEIWFRIEGGLLMDSRVQRCIENVIKIRNDSFTSV